MASWPAVRERAVRDLITADPVYAGFRELHKAFSVPTRKLLSAAETLIRYVEKRGDIPRIGPLVDVYNAVSLETKLSLGAHDLATVTGGISVRLTTGAERYHPVGPPNPNRSGPANTAISMMAARPRQWPDNGEVICRLEVRQSEKTKVTPTTRNVFLIVQGNAATPPAYVQAAMTAHRPASGGSSAARRYPVPAVKPTPSARTPAPGYFLSVPGSAISRDAFHLGRHQNTGWRHGTWRWPTATCSSSR